MKTFEERWTAWLDNRLSDKEKAKFEASLPDKAAADAEKKAAQKLGALLKRELKTDVLTNEDFFSHQVHERIARETTALSAEPRETLSTWWSIRRLFWVGTAALATFLVLVLVVLQDNEVEGPSDFTTTVLKARVDGPDASITPFELKEDRVIVLWTEGLKSLPSDYAAK